jgi:hypothetical protein
MSIADLRAEYHRRICEEIIRVRKSTKRGREYPNFADGDNRASIEIAWGIANRLHYHPSRERMNGQTAGGRFEIITDNVSSSGGKRTD